ncbi:hypothetical protein ZHAS_00012599 [Anopheles sinensis]|uniref:Uncharacterized protein n=1 Tax=Anopheles sinensis TaxID=74873 RepID=A0A084W3B3_ANOSI|nr:hypothetical protein ZHAS_00012599 [Anopheles sinensis]
MVKWAAVSAILVSLLFGLSHASPDLGLDIEIDFVTRNSPNINAAASLVGEVSGNLQGAIGGYQIPRFNGVTSLIQSGDSLVKLVNVITGPVNDVLRNISVIARERQTAPSCMFATINATIDRAYAVLDTAPTLVTNIVSSTSTQNGNAITSAVATLLDALTQITTNLDALYKQVVAVLAAGTVTSSTVSANIQINTLIQLSGSIAVSTTMQRALTTTVQAVRTAFEQANNILTSYNNDLGNAFTSVNNTQRDYYNQIVSRVQSFQSKVTSDTSSGINEIFSTQSRLNEFIQDQSTRTQAQALRDAMISFNTSYRAVQDDYFQKLQTQITQVYTGTDGFVKSTVLQLTNIVNATNFRLAATMSFGGPYAGNCNGRYGGTITSLQNSMRDVLNRALNEYANTGYTDSFVSEYNQVMREQTRYINTRVNFCLNLGSTSSSAIIKAGIARCFTETVAMITTLLQDITFETKLVLAAVNLEGLAMIQRAESTASLVYHGLMAKSQSLDMLLAMCQTTNS